MDFGGIFYPFSKSGTETVTVAEMRGAVLFYALASGALFSWWARSRAAENKDSAFLLWG